MKLATWTMENIHTYRLWQAPFAEKKFVAIAVPVDPHFPERTLNSTDADEVSYFRW